MLLLQMQFSNIEDDEKSNIKGFMQFVIEKINMDLDTPIIRKKISLRIPYIYTVNWITWTRKDIGVADIVKTMQESIIYREHKNNVWTIEVDTSVLIPNTKTSMARLIRFLNAGDRNMNGINMLTTLEQKYDHKKLNSLLQLYFLDKSEDLSDMQIITVR